jgi:hypothetical protein
MNVLNTCSTTLYGVMTKDGNLLTIYGRKLHSTRADAREYRKLIRRKDVRVVKGDFTNYTNWVTAR